MDNGYWRSGGLGGHNAGDGLAALAASNPPRGKADDMEDWVMRAFEQGRRLAREFGAETPVDLAPVLGRLGLETVSWRFAGRVREVIVDGVIGIDERMPESWARWLTAHAVGHHLLHTGTSLYLESWQWVDHSKAERQAEEFAAGLLLPAGAPLFIGQRLLARRCGIPEAKAAYALALWRETG